MTTSCQRARSLVSVGLDSPLNDLEQQFLNVHLGRCGACRAFDEDARAFTTLLREAPLESVPWVAAASDRGRPPRVRFRTVAQVASVASVVIAAGTIALASELPGLAPESSAFGEGPFGSLAIGEESIRSLRREALIQHELPILAATSASPASSETTTALLKPALPVDGE